MQALFETDIDCPYCGARFTTLVDSTAGECNYIEDCAVCCQPIEFHLHINSDEAYVTASRGDDSH